MKTNHMKSLHQLAAVLALPAMSILFNPQAQAAPFIPGNVVVLQEDDGSVPTSTAASPVFLLEFLPSTAGQTLPVQTITIPTNGASRLTQSSGSSSEGFITRSLNTSNVTFVGYDAPVGIANVPGSVNTTSGTNRCVGQVDFNGSYTRTAVSTNAYSGSNIRSSVTDGTNYWMAGTASPTTTEGIWYSPNGMAPVQVTTNLVNARVVRIFNGKLYYSVAGSISSISSLPTGATPTNQLILTGITSSSIYDFAINPAGTVAYVCDDTSATAGAIQKWTNNGTSFVKAFNFSATNGLTAGCRGLAVDFSGANPVIYATTADTATKVIEITDTSAPGAITNVTDVATTLAIAPANTAFRGVALAPPSTSTSTAPSISGISPSSTTNSVGGTAVFTLTGGTGYPTASNFGIK